MFSKVTSWVALDRGRRMAEEWDWNRIRRRGGPRATHCMPKWRTSAGVWRQRYRSSRHPHGALSSWNHPRSQSTVRAIARNRRRQRRELVYRYRQPDGLKGEEGAFSICTFWLAQALAMIGERERAKRVFRRMLRHAVGLYSEEIDPVRFSATFPSLRPHCTGLAAACTRQIPGVEPPGRLHRASLLHTLLFFRFTCRRVFFFSEFFLRAGFFAAFFRGLQAGFFTAVFPGFPGGLLHGLFHALAGALLARFFGAVRDLGLGVEVDSRRNSRRSPDEGAVNDAPEEEPRGRDPSMRTEPPISI